MKRSGTPICLNRCNCELEKTPVRVNIRRGVINIANNPVNLSLFVFVHGCIQQIHYQSTWTAATCRFGLLYIFIHTKNQRILPNTHVGDVQRENLNVPLMFICTRITNFELGQNPIITMHLYQLLKKNFGLYFHANFF